MVRRKTTFTVDEALLRSLKIAAAREDKPEYVVLEDALRRHLGSDLLERIRQRADWPEDEAMDIAVAETRAVRRQRSKRAKQRPA